MQKQRASIGNGAGGGLNSSTELRLHNQLERVFAHCFGAEEGLRVLVKLATAQMLATGTSRTAIRLALSRVVNDHPVSVGAIAAGGGTKSSLRNGAGGGQSRSEALRAMMLQWSDRTDVTDQPE